MGDPSVKIRTIVVNVILVVAWIIALALVIPIIALTSVLISEVALIWGIDQRGDLYVAFHTLIPVFVAIWIFLDVFANRGINKISDWLDARFR